MGSVRFERGYEGQPKDGLWPKAAVSQGRKKAPRLAAGPAFRFQGAHSEPSQQADAVAKLWGLDPPP